MGDIGSPIQHDSHFPPCFKGRKEGSQKKKNVEGGGSQQERGRRKKRKERREEKKGFCILMRLSSFALTKVLSWSD